VLLRRLPRDSPIHRLWAGTKLIALTLLTIATLFNPAWPQLAATAAVTVLSVGAAHVPRNAVPRLPPWYWATLLVGLGFAYLGHGVEQYLSLLLLSALFMVLSAVVAWTTSLDDVAPALRALGAPFRRIGLPVDEWALTAALCVRSLPLVLTELRTVVAARRLRPAQGRLAAALLLGIVGDVGAAAMAAAIRRAADMGEAMTARGGSAAASRGSGSGGRGNRFRWADAVALLVVVAACVLPPLIVHLAHR
jgi:energy-coupling factor transport system permease protein